jgi:hypothetical protein
MCPSLSLTIPALTPAQRRVADESARFNALCCGRRWGKSWFGVNRLIMAALNQQPVAWLSPTYRMLSDAWRMVREVLQPVTVAARADEHRIEIIGGGTVDMFSLDNPDTARGRKFALVIIDEAAIAPQLEPAWTNVIRPTLTDLRGGAWFMSTPKGHNYFWSLFQRGGDGGEWRSWQMPTSSNPYISPVEIEAARRELPERVFAQEYLADFIDDAGAVFRHVNAAATAESLDQAREGRRYIVGVDWGKHEDYTVLSVLDMQERAQVRLERFNQIDYRVQLGRLRALLGQFPGAHVVAEANSIGDPLIEQLREDGIRVQPFVTTPISKTRAVEELALAFETRSIRILPDPVQLGELLAFSSTRLPSGAFRYAAPGGGHDDTVMALAFAWSGLSSALPASLPSPGDPFAESKGQDAVTMTRTATGIKFLRPEHRKRGGL